MHVSRWNNCRDSADVVLHTLEGWRHVWPGPYFTSKLDPADPLYDFEASRIIWDLYKTRKREGH